MAARAPAGSNWRPAAGGFAYDSLNGAPNGLRRITLRSGVAGKSVLAVRGAGSNLALPALGDLPAPVTVQLKSDDAARQRCWSAVYDRPKLGEPRLFRAGRIPSRRPTRPNIVIVSLDDTRADGIDRMPTLARIAAEGVTFTNSFAVNPLCAPSRASLLSGMHSRRHGVRALNGVIGGARPFRESGADRQTIATWLQAAGYMTGLFGKYINGYGLEGESRRGPDGGMYVPPGWSRWRGMTSPEHYGGVRGAPFTLVDEHGTTALYSDRRDDRHYSTDLLAAELRTFIADAASQHMQAHIQPERAIRPLHHDH